MTWEVTAYVYTVTVEKSIDSPSVELIMPVLIDTNAEISIKYPNDIQLSNQPLQVTTTSF